MKTNHEMKMKRAAGFTLLEIMIVVAFIGLLAAISVPAMFFARTKAQTTSCVNNLRQIASAVDQYAFDNLSGAPAMTDLVPVYMAKEPLCPAGGSYTVDSPASCDIATHIF
jgi:prepilin-type N-terminal cleavage/methylation domain-containing protein